MTNNMKNMYYALLFSCIVISIYSGCKKDEGPIGPGSSQTDGISAASSLKWLWQNPLPQGNGLYGVSFINTNIGTLVGSNHCGVSSPPLAAFLCIFRG